MIDLAEVAEVSNLFIYLSAINILFVSVLIVILQVLLHSTLFSPSCVEVKSNELFACHFYLQASLFISNFLLCTIDEFPE